MLNPPNIPALQTGALWRQALIWDNVWPVDLPDEDPVGNGWHMLERFRAAGFDVVSTTLSGDNHGSDRALALVAWARQRIARSDNIALIGSIDEIPAARADGKLGIVFQFEGTRCFERNLDLIEAFYALGVRQTLLAFNNANSVGGGCAEKHDGGLTSYGRRLVAEMQRVGMAVDLSHTGERTSLDALEIATRPCLFSHSNAAALHPSFRNISDAQAIACAATGGVIGISGASEYLGDPVCATETIFAHIDHFASLVGIAHVGLGLDLVFDADALNDWVRQRPDEWPIAADPAWPGFRYATPEQMPGLIGIMADHGYGENDIRAVLGENMVRLCRAAWGADESATQ